METLLNVSLPFFGLIFIGYGAGRTRLITPQAYLGLNAFVIWFALPALLFLKMSQAPVFEAFDPRFVAAYTGGGLIAYGTVAGLSRSEEHTSELQSLMRISYAVFCLKKKNK